MADDEALPPILSGLPPPPPSKEFIEPDPSTLKNYNNGYNNQHEYEHEDEDEPNEYQQEVIDELMDNNHDTAPVYEQHDEVKSHSNTPPILLDHSDVMDIDNNRNNNSENENDERISLECMRTGQLPFNTFYEDLNSISLSLYRYGIPTGLEGLKRRLIEENGLNYEGIFRLRGKENNLQTAKELLNGLKSISDINVTPIEVAQLIKAFYRNLPCDEPGFIPTNLLNAQSETDIIHGFEVLSEPRKSLLLWTFDLWIIIEQYKPKNKMTLQSMSIVFSPNMVRCNDSNPMVFLELQKKVQRIIHDAAKLRKVNRLIDTNKYYTEEIDNVYGIEPFQRDRNVNMGNASAQGPKYAKYTPPRNNNGISDFFKNCVLL